MCSGPRSLPSLAGALAEVAERVGTLEGHQRAAAPSTVASDASLRSGCACSDTSEATCSGSSSALVARSGAATFVKGVVAAVERDNAIEVANGAVGELSGRINGSGSLRFNGRAETAEVAINGAGTVELAHVDAEPRTHLAGAGRISVGNW